MQTHWIKPRPSNKAVNTLPPLRKLPEPVLRVGNQLLVMLPNNLDQEDVIWMERWASTSLFQDPELDGLIVDFTAVHCTDAQDMRHLAAWLNRLHHDGASICITGINPGLAALIDRAGIELISDQSAADLNTLLSRT